jgi:hypothetical protein
MRCCNNYNNILIYFLSIMHFGFIVTRHQLIKLLVSIILCTLPSSILSFFLWVKKKNLIKFSADDCIAD